MTYGDGVSDIDVKKLLNFHVKNKRVGTVTMVKPTVRFGELKFNKSEYGGLKVVIALDINN